MVPASVYPASCSFQTSGAWHSWLVTCSFCWAGMSVTGGRGHRFCSILVHTRGKAKPCATMSFGFVILSPTGHKVWLAVHLHLLFEGVWEQERDYRSVSSWCLNELCSKAVWLWLQLLSRLHFLLWPHLYNWRSPGPAQVALVLAGGLLLSCMQAGGLVWVLSLSLE